MAGQYAALLSNRTVTPLLADSFALPATGGNAPAARARWTEASVVLLDGVRWNLSDGVPSGLEPGTHALYADVDVQVRALRALCCTASPFPRLALHGHAGPAAHVPKSSLPPSRPARPASHAGAAAHA